MNHRLSNGAHSMREQMPYERKTKTQAIQRDDNKDHGIIKCRNHFYHHFGVFYYGRLLKDFHFNCLFLLSLRRQLE